METKEKLENLKGWLWALAGGSVIIFMFVGFALLLILKNGDVHTWPTWAKAVELSLISIAGVSTFISIILVIIQIIMGDEEGYD